MTEATTSEGIEGRPRRSEQVLEHLVGEQVMAMIGQEGLDAPIGNQLATQCCASRSSRLESLCPCTCQFSTIGDQIASTNWIYF